MTHRPASNAALRTAGALQTAGPKARIRGNHGTTEFWARPHYAK